MLWTAPPPWHGSARDVDVVKALQIATTRESADTYRRPSDLGHKLRQTAARPGPTATLRNLKDVEQQPRCNALDAIVAYLTPDSF